MPLLKSDFPKMSSRSPEVILVHEFRKDVKFWRGVNYFIIFRVHERWNFSTRIDRATSTHNLSLEISLFKASFHLIKCVGEKYAKNKKPKFWRSENFYSIFGGLKVLCLFCNRKSCGITITSLLRIEICGRVASAARPFCTPGSTRKF